MSNRLNDIFSNGAFNIGGKLRFKDDEAYKNFLAALEIVQAEGKVVPVEGVTSFSTEISDEAGKYIINHSENVLEFMVGPSKESKKIVSELSTSIGDLYDWAKSSLDNLWDFLPFCPKPFIRCGDEHIAICLVAHNIIIVLFKLIFALLYSTAKKHFLCYNSHIRQSLL